MDVDDDMSRLMRATYSYVRIISTNLPLSEVTAYRHGEAHNLLPPQILLHTLPRSKVCVERWPR